MNSQQSTRARHPKATTRLTILAKALDMYREGRLEPGNEKLSAVLTELGYTTGAGYQIWANQAAFREDLQVYVAENMDYASLEAMADKRAEVDAMQLPLEQRMLYSGDNFFEAFVESEGFYMTLRFFAMNDSRPTEITEALVRAYDESHAEVSQLFQGSLAAAGRRLKGQLTMKDLTAAVTAIFEGYALRHRVDRAVGAAKVEIDGDQHYVFSATFRAVVLGLTEPIPDGDVDLRDQP